MNYLSLFTGVGGMDLGFDRAGWRCEGQVELNAWCRAVLARHWPTTPRHDDVRTAPEWWHRRGAPAVDAVIGGWPCWNLSVANATSRDGLIRREEGSGLFWDAIAVVATARPRYVVLENVPGLLTSNGGADLAAVIGALADVGLPYVEWRVLDSRGFGVAQRRRRVFLVAGAGDPRGGAVLHEREGSVGHPAQIRGARRAAAGRAGEGSARRGALGTIGTGAAAAADADGVGAAARLPRRLDLRGPWVKRGAMNTATEGVESWQAASDGNLPHRTLNTVDWGDARTSCLVVGKTGPCRCCPIDPPHLDQRRYGAMGNAVSPPVAQWIATRLREVA